MTREEREAFIKQWEAKKQQRAIAKKTGGQIAKAQTPYEREETEKPPSKLNIFLLWKKAESIEPIHWERLTPYEREETKKRYQMLTLIEMGVSLLLMLWIGSWMR